MTKPGFNFSMRHMVIIFLCNYHKNYEFSGNSLALYAGNWQTVKDISTQDIFLAVKSPRAIPVIETHGLKSLTCNGTAGYSKDQQITKKFSLPTAVFDVHPMTTFFCELRDWTFCVQY
jgi:hypothetical protein